jgi:hypothetical protein
MFYFCFTYRGRKAKGGALNEGGVYDGPFVALRKSESNIHEDYTFVLHRLLAFLLCVSVSPVAQSHFNCLWNSMLGTYQTFPSLRLPLAPFLAPVLNLPSAPYLLQVSVRPHPFSDCFSYMQTAT